MKLFELFATISLDDKEFTDGVKRAAAAGKQASSSMETMSVKAVALGTALYNAGVQAAKMAGSFVKTSIEAAAQVQAEKAQFESAFGEMAGAATTALKNVEGTTGILYTRLRTVGTKAFSQLKGAGLESAEAMAAMEKYTGLAADAAAYYDISLEDADARLRSFMRGNTEAGDAIGLFTSEAQRNERAMEKYGKKWLDLTEAQKQMLMLDIAGTIYEQSGALGQAASEADSWANVMGNVKSAWTNAIALFGDPLRAAVTPAVQGIIDYLNSEETKTKLEQAGLWLADGFTALYKDEDSPVKNVIAFIGDIASALSSDTGTSVLKAVGLVAGGLWALSSPLNMVIATIAIIASNWDKVKNAVADVGRQIKMLFGIESGTSTFISSSGVEHGGGGVGQSFGAGTVDISEIDTMGGLETTSSPGSWGDNWGVSTSENPFGVSHAKGLPYVPYDNYIARLHRGEQVLTANEAAQRRQGADASGLYSAILAAVRDGVSHIAVTMDGVRVGTLVADTVSRRQAEKTNNDLRARGAVFV